MKRRLALLTAATVVVAGGVASAIAPAGAAAAGCQVDYSVTSQWSGGFTAAVHVTNLGSPLTAWTLGFDFTAGQKVTQGWNAAWSQTGTRVSATNLAWNGSLGTNASTDLGFNGSVTGSNPTPAVFTLNGVTCNGTVTSPSPSPSPTTASPSPSPSPSPTSTTASPPPGDLPPTVKVTSPTAGAVVGEPGLITLAATASDPDGSISKVEFYTAGFNGSPFTLVATVTTAPYTYTLVAAGSGVSFIQAKAYDNEGLTATDTVQVKVAISDLGVVLTSPNTTTVYVEPGTIQLAATPAYPPQLIAKVEFSTASSAEGPFTLVATDTTAPYSYLLNVTAPNVFYIRAVAYDLRGVTATSTVHIQVATPAG
jgi:hypothetical protein